MPVTTQMLIDENAALQRASIDEAVREMKEFPTSFAMESVFKYEMLNILRAKGVIK